MPPSIKARDGVLQDHPKRQQQGEKWWFEYILIKFHFVLYSCLFPTAGSREAVTLCLVSLLPPSTAQNQLLGHGPRCLSTSHGGWAASKQGCLFYPSWSWPTVPDRLLLLQSGHRLQIPTGKEEEWMAASSSLGFEDLLLPPPTALSSWSLRILYLQDAGSCSQHNPKLWLKQHWLSRKGKFHSCSTCCFAISSFLWTLLTEEGMAVNQQVKKVNSYNSSSLITARSLPCRNNNILN